ncbi:MAG: AgmX/PglI C-terminal domain-containing protein [Pseudobdellovibrionaceae bacterium]
MNIFSQVFSKKHLWTWFFLISGLLCVGLSLWWSLSYQHLVLEKDKFYPGYDSSYGERDRADKPLDQDDQPTSYIENILRGQRPLFFKCYSQLLQKGLSQRGQVSLSFFIEKNGRVKSPSVLSSQIQDVTFQSCLVEVLNRTEFKGFKGNESLQTIYPLQFE